jgi:hypothetical protein
MNPIRKLWAAVGGDDSLKAIAAAWLLAIGGVANCWAFFALMYFTLTTYPLAAPLVAAVPSVAIYRWATS